MTATSTKRHLLHAGFSLDGRDIAIMPGGCSFGRRSAYLCRDMVCCTCRGCGIFKIFLAQLKQTAVRLMLRITGMGLLISGGGVQGGWKLSTSPLFSSGCCQAFSQYRSLNTKSRKSKRYGHLRRQPPLEPSLWANTFLNGLDLKAAI